jgi:hypothetical protein
MVGVTRSHHRRFAYDKDRHYPSSSRRWRSCHRRSCGRHRRCCSGAQLYDEHGNDPVHQQHSNHAVCHDHNTVDHHDAQDADATAGIRRSPMPEHGQQVRFGLQFGLWVEFGLGLRRRSSGRRYHRVVMKAHCGLPVVRMAMRIEPPGRVSSGRRSVVHAARVSASAVASGAGATASGVSEPWIGRTLSVPIPSAA